MNRRVLWLLLLVPLGLGLWRLRFDVDVLNLLPSELPAVRGLQLYQKHFANADELIITLESAEAGLAESSARALTERLRGATNLVSSALWQAPWMEHPEQSAELAAAMWLSQPPEVFGEMTNRLAATNLAATLAATRERLAVSFSPAEVARLSFDPFGLTQVPGADAHAAGFGPEQDFFTSPDGTFRMIFVKAASPLPGYRDCATWLAAVRELAETWRKSAGAQVTLGYTGRPAFVTEISSGMERDMTESVLFTALFIAALFWLAHRRWQPMLWLLALLALILGATLALGGLLFGAINVVSLGFAAILLGLAVDYGVVHYQEAMASPDATVPEIRRAIGPSIFWAAVTTITAFLVLNLGGLPGLAQLGSLVALGVALSAVVMLFLFLPPLFHERLQKQQEQIAAGLWPPPAGATPASTPAPPNATRRNLVFGATALLLVVTACVLGFGFPRLDGSSDPLRPKNSLAYAALDLIKTRMSNAREPLWVVAAGRGETEIARHLEQAEPILARAVSNQLVARYMLPTLLWPHPGHQAGNRATAARLVASRESLRAAALAGGFKSNSVLLAEAMLDTWQSALVRTNVFWPTNTMSRWVLEKMVARPEGSLLAVGFVFPATGARVTAESLAPLSDELARASFLLSGWELLGDSLLRSVQGKLARMLVPMVALVLLSLWLAFGKPLEILLSLAVLLSSGLGLLAVMRLAGWSWNLLNLMALPLMLGAGVDYSIFMQLALRRHAGDLAAAHRSVGRALLLCGGTAMAGFGSLAFSSNAGMASLGQVCAVGIGWNMVISVYLLPVWWSALAVRPMAGPPAQPSSLYGWPGWQAGMFVVRRLPRGVCAVICKAVGHGYWLVQRRRREVVIQNLLPAVQGNRVAAAGAGRRLTVNFVQKLADLWRLESGAPMLDSFGEWTGWEHFTAAQARGHGVLLATVHLGNWELGGSLMIHKGVRLLVLSQPEPDVRLTELRQAARARLGIDTLIVGADPFAFIEVIKRLDAGATVALLVDRPVTASAVEVELFGQPFHASVAAAELARASGCAVLPVAIVRAGGKYHANILPEIPYDRVTLGDRESRRQFTQEITRAFEPILRQHPDQWYHFVPIWPGAK